MEPKQRKKVVYLGIAILAGIAANYFFGWLIYYKPAFNGRVIDTETKEPIKGAVVAVFYYSRPIIGGPGGISSGVIAVKETLTNEKGGFHIPLYLRVIHPLSIESRVKFSIYKPGYGNYPDHHVSPPRPGVGAEQFFSGELGTPGEFEWLSKKIKVTYGVVELPKLKTREERLRANPGSPMHFRSKELPLLYEAINEEMKRFGLSEAK